jgi:hypothetical protein
MLTIKNIRELNGEVCGGFNLSHCDFLDSGSNLLRESHYQIQFNKRPPFDSNAQPACLTIGVDSDSRGRYHCKLYYATTNNVIWEEWLVVDVLRKKDALLRSIASMLHTHINQL